MRLNRIFLCITILFGLLGACKKASSPGISPISFKEGTQVSLVAQNDETIVFDPKLSSEATNYQWTENGKSIGTDKVYVFNRTTPGDYEITLDVFNVAGKSTLVYKVKVTGAYVNGVLFLSSVNRSGTGNANISYLDASGKVRLDVFSEENKTNTLSPSGMSMSRFNNKLYITSSTGPNHITVLDDETLKFDYAITQSGVSAVTYFATTDGKTGYVNLTNRRKLGLFPVDLVAKTIGATALTGTTSASLLPINTIENSALIPSGKQLLKVDGSVVTPILTYTENVAGIVKTANKVAWVGVQGTATNKAKFVKLDASYVTTETIELDANFKLPANGILTASGNDEFIYWQETSTGSFCRFNTNTKKAEEVVNPYEVGISFSTAWKVNPKNGDFYIIDSPGLFTGLDSSSDLYIFDNKGKLKKTVKKVGYQVVDMVFPKY
ncbi:MAG: hypothetical protein EOO42_06450 [Flavobacteriales bacterium]|nr:MAG: hypothetical protein EOO42_06450 [Flavobacteriales bacterium]